MARERGGLVDMAGSHWSTGAASLQILHTEYFVLAFLRPATHVQSRQVVLRVVLRLSCPSFAGLEVSGMLIAGLAGSAGYRCTRGCSTLHANHQSLDRRTPKPSHILWLTGAKSL